MKNASYLLPLVFLFICSGAFAQRYHCNGRVIDAGTGEALAFVNIVTNESAIGTATDIDGKFSIAAPEPIEYLRLSYVGYQPKTFYLHGNTKNLTIELQKTSVELEEVLIVAGENPAHRIINNVIANRKKNDPENLPSFSYTSYDKMVFTMDTLEIPPEALEQEADSGDMGLRNFLREKDFFMMETVSERKFMAPDRNYEKVLASRISGFKDPIFLFLSSNLQSPSFYKEFITIFGNQYINPISGGSTRKYFFNIEDTAYTERLDTVFIISYRPRINTNFEGLSGVLSINSNGWAIQNVIAEPAKNDGSLRIRIQQMYELIDGKQWFPVQLDTDITLRNVEVNQYNPTGRGKSYIRDIELNPELVRRMFNQISVEVAPNAGDRSEEYWRQYRGDSLSDRERRTYEFIDSIGKAEDFDRMAGTVKSLLNNRLPLGYVDLDLSKIARYNDYEGLYLGLGLLTSKKLSQTFALGGYWGYGFGDQTAKYGGDLQLTLDRYRELKLRFSYFDDVTETGGVSFWDDSRRQITPENFRNFLLKTMDRTERMHAAISFRALRYATVNFGLTIDDKKTIDRYVFAGPGQDLSTAANEFKFTEVSAGIRYAYKEKFLQMPDTRISMGTGFPVIWLNYTRGLAGPFDGQYEYNKFDLKIEKSFRFKYLGTSTFDLRAGYIDRAVPWSNLYNGHGSYRVFTIYAPSSFATMRMNEFLSDRYAFLFFTHNFGELLWRGRFSPEIAVATNIGIGKLDHPEYHEGVALNMMDKGYIESGLLLNNMLNITGIYKLGFGMFYRYGSYHLPKLADNFAYKITLQLPF